MPKSRKSRPGRKRGRTPRKATLVADKENPLFVFGFSAEWANFQRRNPLFIETLRNLHRAMTGAFIRTFTPRRLADDVVFQLGNVCREDFLEIMLLAGNGYGLGALRLLRGMYERAVNAKYIAQNPEKAEDFVNFGWINIYKTIESIKRTGGKTKLPSELIDQAVAMHEKYKREGRNTSRWSGDLDFESMAMTVGALGKMIVNAYHIPTQQLHSSIQSVVARIEVRGKTFSFDAGPQRERADEALQFAQLVLLSCIDLQKTYFDLPHLEPMLVQCMLDFKRTWPALNQDGTGG